MHDDFSNMPGALFLECSYTLHEDAVETHWAPRALCVHAVDAQWQLFARQEHVLCYGKWEIIRYILRYFHAIPRHSEKFQITVPTPWDCGRVWQGLKQQWHWTSMMSLISRKCFRYLVQIIDLAGDSAMMDISSGASQKYSHSRKVNGTSRLGNG